MRLGGIEPFTTVDFPGHLACVLFTVGCPLKCVFCHNPHLQEQDPNENDGSWEGALEFLETRKKRLDGVVISGGEPLMQNDLAERIAELRSLDFKVALHTSGIFPIRLAPVLKLVDWIGLDIKATPEKYRKICAIEAEGPFESLALIQKAKIPYEVRTTLDPSVLTPEDLLQMGRLLEQKGVDIFALQEYRNFKGAKKTYDRSQTGVFFAEEVLNDLRPRFKKLIERRA